MTQDLSWLTARPIAHRGLHDGNKARWENSLSAFQAAVDRGFAIECDVHLTSDGVPVIFHDPDLARLTGMAGTVCDRSAAEMQKLAIGGTNDRVPLLADLLSLVDGRVPIVVELKGIEGRDDGLVAAVSKALADYSGHAAIMSFDHWLVRQFPTHAAGLPCGLTAYGTKDPEIEGHFAMLAHDISFVSYGVSDLPNRFVTFVREKLAMPVITWTVRDEGARERTFAHADQMTFEGFDPDAVG